MRCLAEADEVTLANTRLMPRLRGAVVYLVGLELRELFIRIDQVVDSGLT